MQKLGQDGCFTDRHLWHIFPKSCTWREVLLICPEENWVRVSGSQQVQSDSLCLWGEWRSLAVPAWHCPPGESSRGCWVWTGQCAYCTPCSVLKGHCWSKLEHKILPAFMLYCILERWQEQLLLYLLGTSSFLAPTQTHRNVSHSSGPC